MDPNLFLVICVVVAVGLVAYYLSAGKKKGASAPKETEGPTAPPPETPGI